jgi:hypothetical protein
MQKVIEFYEMVSLNDAALRGSEKTAILKARLALKMFEGRCAMERKGSASESLRPLKTPAASLVVPVGSNADQDSRGVMSMNPGRRTFKLIRV